MATSLVVREDALTLFGFATDDERDVFELLQTASGVGPRLALAMLAVHTPDALRRAVATEDVTALTRVPGIGRRARSGSCSSSRTGSARPAWRRPSGQRCRRPGWRAPALAGPGPGRAGQPGLAARDADQAIAAVEAELADAPPTDGEAGRRTAARPQVTSRACCGRRCGS